MDLLKKAFGGGPREQMQTKCAGCSRRITHATGSPTVECPSCGRVNRKVRFSCGCGQFKMEEALNATKVTLCSKCKQMKIELLKGGKGADYDASGTKVVLTSSCRDQTTPKIRMTCGCLISTDLRVPAHMQEASLCRNCKQLQFNLMDHADPTQVQLSVTSRVHRGTQTLLKVIGVILVIAVVFKMRW